VSVGQLYAKREDCNSGLAFGGNKLRKLEYIVPDAIASNADTLVSIGGVQSNHTRMVAAVAAKVGYLWTRAISSAASLVKPGISQVAAGAHQSASNSAAQHARRHSVHSERPRATQKLSVGAPEGRQR
jgi:1-aminocyclopropane-1-carboxylate deaminase/D-cysteine desulfhydrase-like pyridoxal-dependent ACC family enzyme